MRKENAFPSEECATSCLYYDHCVLSNAATCILEECDTNNLDVEIHVTEDGSEEN